MINYSIIIPHKNIPDLLQRCLDSIPSREDVQIIVVDDNSDPQIVNFDNFPGKDNPQVELYFTKEGKGAGYARNVGLQHARGKWILFSDADDFFTENIGYLLDKYLNSDFEIIYFKITSVDCKTRKPSKRGDIVNNTIQRAIDTNNEDVLKFQRLEPWGKFISHQLIQNNHIVFDETIAANDLMFSVVSASLAVSVSVEKMPLYCLTARYGSLAHTISIDVCNAKYDVVLNVNDFLRKIGKYKYRINAFHYAWQFYHLGFGKMIIKVLNIYRRMPLSYAIVDLLHYLAHLIKSLLSKKSPLVKVE